MSNLKVCPSCKILVPYWNFEEHDCAGDDKMLKSEGHLKRWMEDATQDAHKLAWNEADESEQSDIEAMNELLALENAAREALESMLNLVCCPAFNGQVFEHDKESHRAWTLTRLSIDKLRSALKAL